MLNLRLCDLRWRSGRDLVCLPSALQMNRLRSIRFSVIGERRHMWPSKRRLRPHFTTGNPGRAAIVLCAVTLARRNPGPESRGVFHGLCARRLIRPEWAWFAPGGLRAMRSVQTSLVTVLGSVFLLFLRLHCGQLRRGRLRSSTSNLATDVCAKLATIPTTACHISVIAHRIAA